MANFKIESITDREVKVSFHPLEREVFPLKKGKESSSFLVCSYLDFYKLFLSDNKNYHIYQIDEDILGDDTIITLHYKYVENKNGNHLFADTAKTISVKTAIFESSKLKQLVLEEKESLILNKDLIDYQNTILSEEIVTLNNRIQPGVLNIIDDFFSGKDTIDFNDYHITKEEFIKYIRRNPFYIRKYILSYEDKLSDILRCSLSVGSIFSLTIIIGLITNNINLATYLSSMLALFGIATSIYTYAYIEKQLHDLKRKTILIDRERIKKSNHK